MRIPAFPLLLAGVFRVNAWCDNGISEPDFADDAGKPSVRVAAVQAPLFSAYNPTVGKIMDDLQSYHTTMMFFQQVDGQPERAWSLEFDATVNILEAMWPTVKRGKIEWLTNNARWCLTSGILWGKEHWSKNGINNTVTTASASQVLGTFHDLIHLRNSSNPDDLPKYNPWRISKIRFLEFLGEPLSQDITCGDGAIWFIHDLAKHQNATLTEGFKLLTTHIEWGAKALEPVNVSDPDEWAEVVHYYRHGSWIRKNVSDYFKFYEFLKTLPKQFYYDTNNQTYHRVVGNSFPWFRFAYKEAKLCPPPFWGEVDCLDPAMPTSQLLV